MISNKLSSLNNYSRPVALIVAFAFLNVTNAKAENDVGFAGVGTQSCGEFANLYKQNPKLVETAAVVWSLGFMSGMNAQAGLDRKRTKNIKLARDALPQLLRSQCDSRPLVSLFEIVFEYYLSLPDSNFVPKT